VLRVVAVVIATELRRPEQLERLLAALIAASTTVLSTESCSVSSRSHRLAMRCQQPRPLNPGSPVFVGAYLIIVAPLVATRVIQSFRSWRSAGTARSLALLVYSVAAGIQVVRSFFTQSQGPWTAWLAGISVERARVRDDAFAWVYGPFDVATVWTLSFSTCPQVPQTLASRLARHRRHRAVRADNAHLWFRGFYIDRATSPAMGLEPLTPVSATHRAGPFATLERPVRSRPGGDSLRVQRPVEKEQRPRPIATIAKGP